MTDNHPAARHNRSKNRLRQVNINKVFGEHLSKMGITEKKIKKYQKKLKELLTLPISRMGEIPIELLKNTNEAEKFGLTASFDDMVELWKVRIILAKEYNSKVELVNAMINSLAHLAFQQQFYREAVEVFEARLDGKLSDDYFSVGLNLGKA